MASKTKTAAAPLIDLGIDADTEAAMIDKMKPADGAAYLREKLRYAVKVYEVKKAEEKTAKADAAEAQAAAIGVIEGRLGAKTAKLEDWGKGKDGKPVDKQITISRRKLGVDYDMDALRKKFKAHFPSMVKHRLVLELDSTEAMDAALSALKAIKDNVVSITREDDVINEDAIAQLVKSGKVDEDKLETVREIRYAAASITLSEQPQKAAAKTVVL